MDEGVPLVVPEINPEALDSQKGIISCPNCTTINLVMTLAPVLELATIRRVVVTAFQSVSGAGSRALDELQRQIEADGGQGAVATEVFSS